MHYNALLLNDMLNHPLIFPFSERKDYTSVKKCLKLVCRSVYPSQSEFSMRQANEISSFSTTKGLTKGNRWWGIRIWC